MAQTQTGWKIDFGLSTSPYTLEVGACDGGSGYDRLPIVGAINADIADGYSSVIHYHADSSFVECLEIEPTISAPASFTLSWNPSVWDPIRYWHDGTIDTSYKIIGTLTDWAGNNKYIDFTGQAGGAISLTSDHSFQLQIATGSYAPVPEPSSLLALGTGLLGLGGIMIRRRK